MQMSTQWEVALSCTTKARYADHLPPLQMRVVIKRKLLSILNAQMVHASAAAPAGVARPVVRPPNPENVLNQWALRHRRRPADTPTIPMRSSRLRCSNRRPQLVEMGHSRRFRDVRFHVRSYQQRTFRSAMGAVADRATALRSATRAAAPAAWRCWR